MPRTAVEMHSGDISIDQLSDLKDNATSHDTDVVRAEQVHPKSDYVKELAFNEEPVTIRLEPSSDENAPTMFPVWVNGKGGEILQNGEWWPIAYFPVGQAFTTKRKYLAVIVGAKINTINTDVGDTNVAMPHNRIKRRTSPVHSFSVIEDKNPLGAAWLAELRRRNA